VNQNRAILTEYTFFKNGNCKSQLITFGERDVNPQPYGTWVKTGVNRYSAHWWFVNGDIIVDGIVYYIYEPGADIMYEEEIRNGQPYRFPHPLKRA
jgi:hypothetical protein